MFRIIGGAASGRRVAIPDVPAVKPAPERVRESLFSILEDSSRLRGAEVLDLFAGSGVMGLESVSRGAVFCTFVENSAPAVEVIRRNIQAVGLPRRCAVKKCDLLSRHEISAAKFVPERKVSLVFFDPPFPCFEDEHNRRSLERLLLYCAESCCTSGAWFVIRHENKSSRQAEELIGRTGWSVVLQKRYGRSCIKIAAPPS